ncbi:DUF6146 family protein [Robiginitalea sp. IMCC44478]|uniref:DUF6146 family protein n=1 Tax=Robiginitalea sp. IMCC44478 TaxID=3459122 RepID=UPI0040422189
MRVKGVLQLYITVLSIILLASCGAQSGAVSVSPEEKAVFEQQKGDPVKIADAESKYEIVIIDPGFYSWLKSFAQPEGYYSQTFLENRNAIYVMNWNQRVLLPMQYDPNLYELQIDYDPDIDYGYEVNYKLYNYFIYFQRKYNQRLGPYLPRI